MRKKRIFGPRRSADRWKLVLFGVLLCFVSAISFSAGFQAGASGQTSSASSLGPSTSYYLHQGHP